MRRLQPLRHNPRVPPPSFLPHGIHLLRHGLGLPPQVQALLRRPLPAVRPRRTRGRRAGGRAQLPADRREFSRALHVPRPRRSAAGRHVPREDRPRDPVGRRVAARSGARARHVQGHRSAARQVRGAGRREGRRADDGRHPHRRHRRRSPGARRLDDLGGERGRFPRRPRRAGEAAGVHGQALGALRAPRHAAVGPVGDDAQLARGAGAGLQLLRRHARLVDRQAVAARPRVAEQPVARDARRQLLQPLVRGPQLPAARVQRLRSVDRARRRRLSVLHQDEAADRQPARGQPDRDPRLADRRARLRGDHDGPSRAHGHRVRLAASRTSSRSRARSGRTAPPTRTSASAATASTSRCWARCSKRRGSAAARRRDSPPLRRRAA